MGRKPEEWLEELCGLAAEDPKWKELRTRSLAMKLAAFGSHGTILRALEGDCTPEPRLQLELLLA